MSRLKHAANFDIHVFETREGTWGFRVDGLGVRVVFKHNPTTGRPIYLPEDALITAGSYVGVLIEKLCEADTDEEAAEIAERFVARCRVCGSTEHVRHEPGHP